MSERPHMLTSQTAAPRKGRKRTITQILRKAYNRLCRDKATRRALRQHLKD